MRSRTISVSDGEALEQEPSLQIEEIAGFKPLGLDYRTPGPGVLK
jgi:hypothetical protein